jgi:glycosyltransferase involved in cell wall biosynthesis
LPGLLEQLNYKGVELLVLDDSSSDESYALTQKMGAELGDIGYGHFRVLQGKTLPAGWVGKNWACHQLAQYARGGVLIFTDADVLWEKGALAALLEQMERQNADLLSVWPRQKVGNWGERLIVPLIDDVLLTLFPYPLIYVPFRLASAGNGQLMAFRRSAYEQLGGHASVCGEVLEDVKLARKLKGIGGRLRLALGGTVIGVRMYHGYVEALEGFGKNLRSFHGGSMVLVLASMLFHILAYTLPWLLLKRGFASVALLGLLERYLVNVKTGRTEPADLLEPLTTPLSPLATLPIYARALKKKYRWKGREYKR